MKKLVCLLAPMFVLHCGKSNSPKESRVSPSVSIESVQAEDAETEDEKSTINRTSNPKPKPTPKPKKDQGVDHEKALKQLKSYINKKLKQKQDVVKLYSSKTNKLFGSLILLLNDNQNAVVALSPKTRVLVDLDQGTISSEDVFYKNKDCKGDMRRVASTTLFHNSAFGKDNVLYRKNSSVEEGFKSASRWDHKTNQCVNEQSDLKLSWKITKVKFKFAVPFQENFMVKG